MKILAKRLLYWVLIGLPVASLAINAITWLRYGLDLPMYDDWRGYDTGEMHSLSPGYLFRPVNDTMTPVGFALDAIAQRFLDGNSIAYQFLSMLAVLGGLLLLQWWLLKKALGNNFLAASCFVLTLLMLQPDTYWGQQNMAYHQALPLVFILSCLALLLSESARNIWRFPLMLTLSLLAGFSYISGAFGVLAVGLALLLVSSVPHSSQLRVTLKRGGLLLTLSGFFSSAVQYWLAIPGLTTHRVDAPMALPVEFDFWIFFLGKIGRALALPQEQPMFALVATLTVVVTVFMMILLFALRGTSKEMLSAQSYRVGAIFVVLTALVFVYLLLISAGRSNLRPPDIRTPMQVFLYGFYRFHFFWATLLWPWLAAGLLITWKELRKTDSVKLEWTSATLAILLVPILGSAGVFSHAEKYKEITTYRLPTVSCLSEQLQRGGNIYCPEFFMPDFRAAYAYGRLTGASFIRHYPILPISLGTEDPAPWFRWTRDQATVTTNDIRPASIDEAFMVAGTDAKILFRTGKAAELTRCLLLDVNVRIQTTLPTSVQIFYRTQGQLEFKEEVSQRQQIPITGKEMMNLSFQLSAPAGFEDVFRFDPVDNVQAFRLQEMEVRCRWSLASPLSVF